MKWSNVAKHLRNREFMFLIWRTSPALFRGICRLRGLNSEQSYALMQKVIYRVMARDDAKKLVVGFYEEHERYDYESRLLRHAQRPPAEMVGLDFACGPGRMIKRMAGRLARVDGIDISETNMEIAARECGALPGPPRLFVSNGMDLRPIGDEQYDLVFSTIALQHIPVHSIRYKLFQEMFRVLKPGGLLAVQMAYTESLDKVRKAAAQSDWGLPFSFADWNEDAVAATSTNGLYDVAVTAANLPQVKADLEALGFSDVRFEKSDPPHWTHYDAWLFISAHKPNASG